MWWNTHISMSTYNIGNSKSQALKCRQFYNSFDLYSYCPACRRGGGGGGKGFWQWTISICASFSERQREKLMNHKHYLRNESRAQSVIFQDECKLFGNPHQMFIGLNQELESKTQNYYQFPPSYVIFRSHRPQQLDLE